MGVIKSRSSAARSFVRSNADYLGVKGVIAHGFKMNLDGWLPDTDHTVAALAELASRQAASVTVTDMENKKKVLGEGVVGGSPFADLSPGKTAKLISGDFPDVPEVKEEEQVTFKDETTGKNRLGKMRTGAVLNGSNGDGK